MIALVFTLGGDVYARDLDPERTDVVRSLLDSPEVATLDLPELDLRILHDGLATSRRMNLAGTMLLLASGRRPIHALRGDLVILGRTVDDEATDVPDALVSLF